MKTFMLVVMLILFCAPTFAQKETQDSTPMLWDSGNSFLDHCDENSVIFMQHSGREKQSWILACDYWLEGIQQGIQATEQMRPRKPATSLTPAQQKLAEAQADYLHSLGIDPLFSTPSGNMCMPRDVTLDQLRMVVVKWMRDNPAKLSGSGIWLAYAAIKNTYPCSEPKSQRTK